MENKSKFFYITVLSVLLSAGFFQDTSRAEKNVGSFPENEPALQSKSANKNQKDGIQENHPFMGLNDIEARKPKPTKKEIDISSDKNTETAKVPEKQPGWFEKTFWLSFRGWIKESNRNDPNNEDQP